jgi:hypothetical protein
MKSCLNNGSDTIVGCLPSQMQFHWYCKCKCFYLHTREKMK